jgi:hypothetical protein
MTVVLRLDTKATLFEPNEIEIDGQLLKIKQITLSSLERIQNLQEGLAAGSAKAIREALENLVDGDVAPLLSVPIGKIKDLITILVEKSISAGLEEKNGSGPGAKS